MAVAAQQDLDPTPTAANARDHPDPVLKCPVPVHDGFQIERPWTTRTWVPLPSCGEVLMGWEARSARAEGSRSNWLAARASGLKGGWMSLIPSATDVTATAQPTEQKDDDDDNHEQSQDAAQSTT